MIQANELRIGNWVRIRDYILYVKAISETLYLGNNSTSDFIHGDFEYSVVHGIELEPELLEKCGFDNKGLREGCYRKDSIYLMLGLDGYAIVDSYLNRISISIKYLHQLQNLYYCLCGEELEVVL